MSDSCVCRAHTLGLGSAWSACMVLGGQGGFTHAFNVYIVSLSGSEVERLCG